MLWTRPSRSSSREEGHLDARGHAGRGGQQLAKQLAEIAELLQLAKELKTEELIEEKNIKLAPPRRASGGRVTRPRALSVSHHACCPV